MWLQLNHGLKHKLPRVHRWLKARTTRWRCAREPLVPVPKRIRGEFFWVHPRVLATDAHDAEPHIHQWIVNALRVGGTLFDVGAHYGWLSLSASRRVGKAGCVVAFEPSPVLFEILTYHRVRNHVPQMQVVGAAVSEVDLEQTDLYLLNGGLSSRNSLVIGRPNLAFLEGDQRTRSKVVAVTLDTFCEARGLIPDVIKIDVEGAEAMVLRGALQVLREFRPVLVISMHPYWQPAPDSVGAIMDLLASIGYRARDSRVCRFGGYEIGDYLLVA